MQFQSIYRVLDPDNLSKELLFKGVRWEFAPGCAPWRQASAESLIGAVKKCLFIALGSQVSTLIEIRTALFETASLFNDRPVGRHPTQPKKVFVCHLIAFFPQMPHYKTFKRAM